MTKENYLSALESIKETIKINNDLITKLKEDYISENQPCQIGESVYITLGSGRKVDGIVKSFSIFNNEVHVSSYQNGSKTLYITVPNKDVIIF
jgi:small nuclear ribonucleoprotein (snRNP)-like protein